MFNRLRHDRQNRQTIQRVWELALENNESDPIGSKRLSDYKEGLHSAVTTVLYNRASTGFSKYPVTLKLRKELQQWANKEIRNWEGDLETFEKIREMIVKDYPESYPGGPKMARLDCLTASKRR